MKDRLKNNIGLKVLAVVFASFLWWMVVNVDDPIDMKKFNVNVSLTNPEVITNAGKSYQVLDNTQKVAVTVKARRKVLSEITSRDIVATADFREMQDMSIPIRVQIQGFEGEYEEASAYPRNVRVKVENIQKKTFPITIVAVGIPREGYMVGSMEVAPQTVDISGPETLIKSINRVVAKVDVSELKDKDRRTIDAEVQTQLLYYDASDTLISKDLLTSNCDKNGVVVLVDMWKTKSLELRFDTSAIRPAKGYSLAGIEVEPQFVEVVANPQILDTVTHLDIDAEVLKKENISENEELIVDILEYMPEGIQLVNSDASKVAVRILIEKSGTKSIQWATGAIQILNLNEDKYKVEYGQLEVELTFTGPKEALDKLNTQVEEEQIQVSIDLEDYQEKGIHKVPIQVENLPTNCTYDGKATVTVTISRK